MSVSPLVVPAMFPLRVIGPLVVSSEIVLVAVIAFLVLMPPEARALSVPPAKTMPPAALDPLIWSVSATSVPPLSVIAPVKLLMPESVNGHEDMVPVPPESVSPAVVLAMFPPSEIGPLVVSKRIVLVAESTL